MDSLYKVLLAKQIISFWVIYPNFISSIVSLKITLERVRKIIDICGPWRSEFDDKEREVGSSITLSRKEILP